LLLILPFTKFVLCDVKGPPKAVRPAICGIGILPELDVQFNKETEI
jgi:hypothetical protein